MILKTESNIIKSKATNDAHLRNMIEDYNRYIQDSNISLISIQHLLYMKYSLKLKIDEIIEQITPEHKDSDKSTLK
jgi:hypothetical protein